MCEESATAENLRAATPATVTGTAVDPITLKPVDEVVVTTLVDNVYDALLGGQETITRAPFAAGIAADGFVHPTKWIPSRQRSVRRMLPANGRAPARFPATSRGQVTMPPARRADPTPARAGVGAAYS